MNHSDRFCELNQRILKTRSNSEEK